MKHGAMVLALACGLAAGVSAGESPGGQWEELSLAELSSIEGGDLMLAVDRDKQMMTVTRITPGNYDNIQCYSVKVTTAVVRNKDVKADNSKGAMENKNRELKSGDSTVLPKQFPTGPAKVQSKPSTQAQVEGPVLRTDASQKVTQTDGQLNPTGELPDGGYNIHYVDPSKSTNTLGCIGVQSRDGMDRIVDSLKVDNASYSDPSRANQTVWVSAYTNGVPPPPSVFFAKETVRP